LSRIAIVGPGAVGCTVGAWLSDRGGHEVVLCARRPLERLEVETPDGKLVTTPRVFTDPEKAEPVDWVLVATKAYDSEAAARWFRRLLAPHTRVAILQNGVEHVERFAEYAPAARIVPVVIDCPSERSAPGVVRQRRAAWMVVPAGPNGTDFVDLFAHTALVVRASDDFTTEAWKKLCLNSVGAVSAIVNQPSGIARFGPVAELMRGIARECVAVGRARGAMLPDELPDTIVEHYQTGPIDSVNSLHADRIAGRRMEIDARNGAIVRFGRKHGVPTPLNEMAVALLLAIENANDDGKTP
jgi:2-dehydropantoate 2-reductase